MDFKVKLYLTCLGIQFVLGVLFDLANYVLGQPLFKLDLRGYIVTHVVIIIMFTVAYNLAWLLIPMEERKNG